MADTPAISMPLTEGTVVTQTSPSGPPGKILALAAAAHPLSILILSTSAGVTIILIAVARFWDKVDDNTLFAILGMFFSFLGGVVSGRAMATREPQRSGDVTTTTMGPVVSTVTTGSANSEEKR